MTASNFDISSFRAEPPLPANGASTRGDRASENAFADILRAQNAEYEAPADDQRADDAPRDDAPTSSVEKPAPRQTAKEKDAPAKPRQNDNAKTESAPTAPDALSQDEPAKPQAAHDDANRSDRSTAPATDAGTAPTTETPPQDAAVPQLAAIVAVPVAPAPVAAAIIIPTDEGAMTAPVEKTAAPAAPVPPPLPDPSMLAGNKAPTISPAAHNDVPAAQPAPVAPENAGDAAAPNFDPLIAAAVRAAAPRETRAAPVSVSPAPAAPVNAAAVAATPMVAPTAPEAANLAATTPASAIVAAAIIPAAPAATTIAADPNTDGTASAADAEAEAVSLAAVVKRPAAPRNAEPRAAAPNSANVTTPSEPTLSDAEPVEAPAPRSGAGALTAATGLAAQVKGQELQNTPQSSADAQKAVSADKAPIEAASAKSAAPEIDAAADRDAANTPSTARTSDGHAAQTGHDSAVRGTSFTDALSAARGARASANPLVAQVVVQVTKAVSEGQDRITIKLSPADLGRIEVRLDIGADGKIQAVFAADKPQTVEMLQRDARELERALQDAGLRADSGSLSFNLRGEQRDGNGAPVASNKSDQSGADTLSDVPAASAQIYSTTTAGNGRLDIHV